MMMLDWYLSRYIYVWILSFIFVSDQHAMRNAEIGEAKLWPVLETRFLGNYFRIMRLILY